ncbi:hypothetical protein Tco_0955361 [Tanacetum coccineum]|uniref:Uncharacterized protein n=1 Tax=Tanacetum coccineum TaxID=301880 RepID=A0ABQ5E737_9ASTR
MANLSPVGSLNDDTVEPRYDSDILSKVPHYDTYHDYDMLNSNIQELGYIENIVSNNESYDELTRNLILAEESRLKMLEKQTVVNTKPIDYSKLNKLYEYFVPQTQLSVEQLFWSSTPSPPVTVSKPKVFSKKLPSTSQVLKNLNKARELLTKFDECIKGRITLSPHEIGSWEQSDIKGAFKKDVMPFSENLKETFKFFKKGFIAEVKEMKDIFEQMKDEIDQCSVAKEFFDSRIQKIEDENASLAFQISENNNLRAQLKGKFSESQMNHNGTSVNTKLSRPLTLGNKLYSVTPLPKSKVIPKVVEKNDLSKSVPSHLNTKKIIEKCTKVLALATLHELLEEARALKPLDEHIGHASKFTKRIQELLVYVSAPCPLTQSGNEKWAPATSHRKNNKPYVDASRTKQTIEYRFFHSMLVKFTVVDTHSKRAIFLFDKQNQSSPW